MNTHKFDGVSFVAGLVLAAMGLWFLIPGTPTEILDNIGDIASWIWPAIFVVVGIAVLVPALAKTRQEPED